MTLFFLFPPYSSAMQLASFPSVLAHQSSVPTVASQDCGIGGTSTFSGIQMEKDAQNKMLCQSSALWTSFIYSHILTLPNSHPPPKILHKSSTSSSRNRGSWAPRTASPNNVISLKLERIPFVNSCLAWCKFEHRNRCLMHRESIDKRWMMLLMQHGLIVTDYNRKQVVLVISRVLWCWIALLVEWGLTTYHLCLFVSL